MSAAIYTTLPGLRVTRKGGSEMELFSASVGKLAPSGFSRIFHEERYGKMDFEYFTGEGFQIWHSHYLMREHINVCSLGDVAMLELHIPLSGEAMSWFDGEKENRLRKFQFELEYIPSINSETLFRADNSCVTLDIHYDFSFLQLFAQRFAVIEEFLLKVELQQRTQLLGDAIRFISPAMMEIVKSILQYRGEAIDARLFYHQQVSILLEMVLARAMCIRDQYSAKKYLEAAMSVRELIQQHPSVIYSGQSLSAHTGINVSLLHKIFKEYNGTTLFEFGLGVRLDHAKQLLADTSLYIFEIAMECGYLDPSNLTHAFRNRFGVSPQEYRDALKK